MKRFKNLKSIALAVIVGISTWSCVNNDEFGIPSIEIPKPTEIEASTADSTMYKDGAYVKVHGNILVEGSWSYFVFKDGTKIQIYGASKEVSESLTPEQKKKLETNGQELTVTGYFKDYTLKNGKEIKEIVYESAEDLVFGETPSKADIKLLEAAEATIDDYKVGETVKVHGNILVDGKWSYFVFKDGTKIQIYGASRKVSESLSEEQKKKLATNGQELTVIGVFTDYERKDKKTGDVIEVIKEIIYNSPEDLIFGDSVSVTPPAQGDVKKLEAESATVKDYEDNKGKEVELHGKVTVKNNRAYFVFSDKTEIQVYVKDFRDMSKEDKDKLNTEGQEVTIVGTFDEHKGTKQIQTTHAKITFGATPDTGNGNGSGNGGEVAPVQGNVFDFENLPGEPSTSYGVKGELKATDGTVLTYEARTSLDNYAISGKGLMLKGGDSHIKLTFKTDVKKVKLAYKAAYGSPKERKIIVYKGGVDSKEVLVEKSFPSTESGEFEFDLKGAKEITIKVDDKQVVFDNISWSTDGAGNVKPQPTPPTQGGVLNAADLKESDYKVNETAKIKGTIVIKDKKSYFKFSDGTMVRIFAYSKEWASISNEIKKKLNTEGQEVTVNGTFKDINGEKGLQFKQESDLEFGAASVDAGALKASDLTENDYKEGEKAKIYGKVIRENNKTFFELKDKTRLLVFAYTNEWKGISDENKKKLSTEGQYVTVDGVYKKFNNDYPMGLRFFKNEDLKFAN